MKKQALVVILLLITSVVAAEDPPSGWTTIAPRNAIKPDFSFQVASSDDRATPALTISGSGRRSIDGAWARTFSVTGGQHVRFSALRVTSDVESPRRSAVAKITWQNDAGELVQGVKGLARPEYPVDRETTPDGQTLVADTYCVPHDATQARVELHLRWTQGSVTWSHVELRTVDPPPARIVRLATVHFHPTKGTTNREKCEQFAPLIAEAGRQRADLVCLPESLTYYHSGRSMVECAEPIPGPSTEYFGELARRHNLYIVAGLTESDGPLAYNTAVLVGPDGKLQGKYRKVCLPREEIEAGLTPGDQYPVFDTRFGKVGMMICWDVHFPEVARNLHAGGAEVIAMPIWGGNPTLAAARAIENQLYLVSSTYTSLAPGMMVSGIWNPEGRLLIQNDREWGKVLVVEVDLAKRIQWDWLGDLKARIDRERPAGGFLD